MLPVPNLVNPLVGKMGRIIIGPWTSFFQQFVQAPPPILNITVSASPFEYTAVEPGILSITGGTISAITLTRGNSSIVITGNQLITVAINDVVTVTYSVLPTIQFLPSYGQRTG